MSSGAYGFFVFRGCSRDVAAVVDRADWLIERARREGRNPGRDGDAFVIREELYREMVKQADKIGGALQLPGTKAHGYLFGIPVRSAAGRINHRGIALRKHGGEGMSPGWPMPGVSVEWEREWDAQVGRNKGTLRARLR